MRNKEQEAFNPKEYWEDRINNNPDLSGVGITIFGKGFNFWAYQSRRIAFRKLISKLNTGSIDSLEVADIGSGTGFYIDVWSRLSAKKITGFDLTEKSVDILRYKYKKFEFHQCDISDSNAVKKDFLNRYDVISCMDVLFHIVDDEAYQQAFVNLSKMLNSAGFLIFSENWTPKSEQFNGYWFVMKTPEQGNQVLAASNLHEMHRIPFMYLFDAPRKEGNGLIKFYWKYLIWILRRFPSLGWPLGALIFPFEFMLHKFNYPATGVELFCVKKV